MANPATKAATKPETKPAQADRSSRTTRAAKGPRAATATRSRAAAAAAAKANPADALDPVDLRARILAAAEHLLEEDGLAALSMREVARRSGVTHQAPYHHFADRESILAELVTQGFDELTRRLAAAHAPGVRGGAEGRVALWAASGMAYVEFALDHPGVFRIMFRPEVCELTRFPAALAAGGRAYAELQHLVRLLHRGQCPDTLAHAYWSQVHGLACLLVDGPVGQQLTGPRVRRSHARETLAWLGRHLPEEEIGA